VNKGDVKFQAVMKNLEDPIRYEDLSELSTEKKDQRIKAYQMEDRERYFNLSDPSQPLWRVKIFTCGKDVAEICLTIHHAIMDGWSLTKMFNSWGECYEKLAQNETLPEAPQDPSYKEFVALEKEAIASGDLKKFWQLQAKELDSVQPKPQLQLSSEDRKHHLIQQTFSQTTLSQIFDLSKQLHVSAKVIFLSAFLETMRDFWKKDSVAVAIVTNGRSELLSNPFGAMGIFWNFMPYFGKIESAPFSQVAQEVQRRLLKLEEGAALPFSEVIAAHPPLKDVSVSFNFTDFDRFENNSSAETGGTFSNVDALDQFHFPMNCFIGLDANGGESVLHLNCTASLLSKAQFETFAEMLMTRLNHLATQLKRAA
jgi:hypothetical protein